MPILTNHKHKVKVEKKQL